MFRSKTTFVIGAGASYELGLPIGNGLTGHISEALRIEPTSAQLFADDPIYRAVQDHLHGIDGGAHYYNVRAMAQIASRISDNMPLAPSIDNYLNTHRDDTHLVWLGKVAIARCILAAEHDSHLYGESGGSHILPMNNNDLRNAWHIAFWQMLVAGIEMSNLPRLFDNIRFIVFNYDRCLEHFLFHAIQTYFNVEPQVAAELISKADIVHAYGKVGGLPWEADSVTVPFGHYRGASLNKIAGELLTFTETVDDGVQSRMHNMIANAETIVFLGFGFIEQNMQLIAPTLSGATRVFATTYGMSPPEVVMATGKIGWVIGKRPEIDFRQTLRPNQYQALTVEGTCSALFSSHRLRLTEPKPPVIEG